MNRRHFMQATGSLLLATPFGPLAFAAEAAEGTLKLRTLYNKDQSFSPLAKAMEGQRVSVDGFMAPPLKADSKFFVLTKMPMATCPFCETEAEWPDDILAVYTKRSYTVVSYRRKIITRGVLELGSYRDPDTGFLSRVRLSDATFHLA
ncbi:hypothetical protein [Pseudovibrio exalbescens]|uniref:hypothetical protein n=1 Tax=Pseudovibrio exalbescens TaxID=197461 RepID=UPI000C9D065A|nr:hypothetical protein [Pseudovibrio exalbescens]